MNKDHIYYVAYMLRLWLEDGQEFGRASQSPGQWRASLEDPHTQEIQIFTGLEALFDFLAQATEQLAMNEDERSTNEHK